METFFQIAFLTCSLVSNIYLYKKFSCLQSHLDVLQKLMNDDIQNLGENIEEIEIKTVKISAQLDSIQSEIYRILAEQKESLSSARPIKPNNWDSLKEAFKGPCRVTINERN